MYPPHSGHFSLDGFCHDIKSHIEEIIKNEKIGNLRYIYHLLLKKTGINSKIGELARYVDIAIEQEKKINEDIHQCKGNITCNTGEIISMIKNDSIKIN